METKSYEQQLRETQSRNYVKNATYKRYGGKRRSTSRSTAFMKKGVGYFPEYETLDLLGRKKDEVQK